MSDDSISRQAAIDAVRKCSVKEVTPAYMLIDKAEAMTELMMLPSAEPEQRWIPCSERLPEAECGESESALVCFENGTQDVLYFNGGNWCYPTGETYISRNYKNGWHNEVVAWMPLPKPWEGEQKND